VYNFITKKAAHKMLVKLTPGLFVNDSTGRNKIFLNL
jgi:hypothetical protein